MSESKAKGVRFFSAKDLDHIATEATGPTYTDIKIEYANDEVAKSAASLLVGAELQKPYIKPSAFQFEDCGLHLGVFEFAPGVIIPLHSHPDNCVYYVERGSVLMGYREIGPGEGFLTRANQPYGFIVGPHGLRLLEFTTGPRTSFRIHDRHIDRWRERVEKAVAKLETV